MSHSPLSAAQGENAFLGEHVERWWVNAILIDDNELLVGSVANLLL